jgi:hypothetical protein
MPWDVTALVVLSLNNQFYHATVLPLNMYVLHVTVLPLNMSVLHVTVLPLDMSVLHVTVLPLKFKRFCPTAALCCLWTCLSTADCAAAGPRSGEDFFRGS